jgi:hypothetical protein
MPINKEHLEFFVPDTITGWHSPPGYPSGIQQKILAGSLDEPNRRGHRTRFLRFDPGAYSTAPFVHEYWEEVWLVSGDLIVGSDRDGNGGEKFVGAAYACRPPGIPHGPFKSDAGCLLLEIHYFDETTP